MLPLEVCVNGFLQYKEMLVSCEGVTPNSYCLDQLNCLYTIVMMHYVTGPPNSLRRQHPEAGLFQTICLSI